MTRKIILFIPSIEGGGVEKNFFLILNYLEKKFKKIFIVTANTNYKDSFHKNIVVICPKTKKWVRRNRKLKTIISMILLIRNFFNKKILILSFQSNISAILVSKLFNFKILIRLNTSIEKYIKNFLKKIIFKFFYNLADDIIVNSIYFKKEIKKQLNLKSNLIYNSFEKSNQKKKLFFFKNYKGLKIINIGRLTDQKDQITLIKALNLLKKKKIDFRCCIIGGGKEKNKLSNYINSKKLDKFIKLIGYKKNAHNYLSTCDLFVLTSKFEGLPNVLIEAQSKNIPVISSNCPTGPREILLEGALGDLFKVSDYKRLSKLMINFKIDKKRLIQKSMKSKKYLKRFDLKKNCEKYEALILKHY